MKHNRDISNLIQGLRDRPMQEAKPRKVMGQRSRVLKEFGGDVSKKLDENPDESLIPFYEIPKHVNDLVFDGTKDDLRLHAQELFHWWTDDKADYERIENDIDTFEIKRDSYHVYAWCDISGFDYWSDPDNDSNYVQITVSFENPELPRSDLSQLESDVDEMLAHFEQYDAYGMDELYSRQGHIYDSKKSKIDIKEIRKIKENSDESYAFFTIRDGVIDFRTNDGRTGTQPIERSAEETIKHLCVSLGIQKHEVRDDSQKNESKKLQESENGFIQLSADGDFSIWNTVTYGMHGQNMGVIEIGEKAFELHAGGDDDVRVYKSEDRIYIISENTGLGYKGLQVIDLNDADLESVNSPEGEIFLSPEEMSTFIQDTEGYEQVEDMEDEKFIHEYMPF